MASARQFPFKYRLQSSGRSAGSYMHSCTLFIGVLQFFYLERGALIYRFNYLHFVFTSGMANLLILFLLISSYNNIRRCFEWISSCIFFYNFDMMNLSALCSSYP